MRSFFVLSAIAFCFVANAYAVTQEQFLACQLKGEVFEQVADSREHNMTPETTYQRVGAYANSGIPSLDKAFIKNAINLVFFDPRFENAYGPRFQKQMTELCLSDGKPRFQPLK